MKRLFKLAFIALMMSQIASCGKENNSGGGSGSSNSGITNDGVISGVFDNGNNLGDYSAVRSHYTSASFSNGLSTNMVIYHIGPYFGGQSSSGFSTTVSGCLNLFVVSFGDCDNINSNVGQLESIVDRGEYKVVRSTSSSSVTYDVAVGTQSSNLGGDFVYQPDTFDSTDDAYRDMLNLDDISVRETVVSEARITLSNGETVNGEMVEYFYTNGNIRRFVLSSALPLMANPLLVIENNSVTGRLNNVGETAVTRISADIHGIQFNPFTGESTTFIQQNISL